MRDPGSDGRRLERQFKEVRGSLCDLRCRGPVLFVTSCLVFSDQHLFWQWGLRLRLALGGRGRVVGEDPGVFGTAALG